MNGQLLCLLCVTVSVLRPCVSVIQLTATPTESYFFSPNYPQKYGDNVEQSWLLVASDPSHVIHMEVVDSEIEASTQCLYDYVQVHDGSKSEDSVIGRFCGTDAPNYITSGRSMYVLFSSDDSGRYKGFYIRYYSSLPSTTTQHPSTSIKTPTSLPTTKTTFLIPDTTSLGASKSKSAQAVMTTTSLVGILIAVAFCLTVFIVIIASVCIHNANKVRVQPTPRPTPNEDDVWKKISGSSYKPRRPIPFHPESDLSSRSTTSTNWFNTSTTSGFSSGAPCSPSTLHPIIANSQFDDHHYHTLSPVPEATKSMNSDEVDSRYMPQSNQYAYLDMMELSPRRLLPLRVPHSSSSPRDTSTYNKPKVSFNGETSDSDVTNTPRSDHVTGLPSALKKAREARRERYKQTKKSGDEFERGHAHSKHSLINRIDLVRCGVLTGDGSGVPRIDSDDVTRKARHFEHAEPMKTKNDD